MIKYSIIINVLYHYLLLFTIIHISKKSCFLLSVYFFIGCLAYQEDRIAYKDKATINKQNLIVYKANP